MNEELQRKIQEAKDAGYSDEEIQTYLANVQTPIQDLKNQPTMNRSEEYTGMAQAAGGALAGDIGNVIGKAIEYGVPAAAVGYGAYKGGQILRGPSQPSQFMTQTPPTPAPAISPAEPVRPIAPTGEPTLNPTWDKALRQPPQTSVVDRATQLIRNIALDKVLKGSLGLGLATYSSGLNKGEEEELARRRAMGYRP